MTLRARRCAPLALVVDTSLSGTRVVRELDAIIAARGKPLMIPDQVRDQRQRHRADQPGDPEVGAGAAHRVALHRSRQGSPELVEGPQQNGYVESFNGRLRDECLNETLFVSLGHARSVLRLWRDDYNHVRPHSGIGGLTPADAARRVVQPRPRLRLTLASWP